MSIWLPVVILVGLVLMVLLWAIIADRPGKRNWRDRDHSAYLDNREIDE